MVKRKECKECPWKVKSVHNVKWQSNLDNLIASKWRKDKKHNCHMIENVWGDVSDKTICIGSIKAND